MQKVLNKLIKQETLSEDQAFQLLVGIAEDQYDPYEVTGIIVALQTRILTLEELAGFRSALLSLAEKPAIDGTNAIDLCGTGGDGKNTFNISTTTALVLAGMGYKVIKHGNYGVSSLCGSSNVLEALGYEFTKDEAVLNDSLAKHNICFLHAPLFHPAMKKVAPIRKALGIPTFFNIMGPLVNPVQPDFQLTGTFNLAIARMYSHLLNQHRKHYKVVYAMDGYDEISLTGDTRIFGKHIDQVVNASHINEEQISPDAIKGGDTTIASANIITSILKGKGTKSQNTVIAYNTAHALQLFHPEKEVAKLYTEVYDYLKSGEGILHFNQLIASSKINSPNLS